MLRTRTEANAASPDRGRPQRARALALSVVLAAAPLFGWATPAAAQACTPEQLASEVDAAGERLRAVNAQSMADLDSALRAEQRKQGWSEPEYASKVAEVLRRPELISLDREAYQHFSRIEDLSAESGGDTCARLEELRGHVGNLFGAMNRKRQTVVALLAGAEPLAPEPPKPVAAAEPAKPAAAETPKKPKKPEKPKTKDVAAVPQPVPATGWTADSALEPGYEAPPMPGIVTAAGLPEPFTIEEITQASHGLFGTISAQLAGVLAHAFQDIGRPNGYIMGDEASGAFLAGLRYGTGKLYMKDGSQRRVYWHGPSIGLDVGGTGSRTLFLVYNLRQQSDLFTAVSGVDGSAYVVGGFGMTALTDGTVVMVPIHSGVGLRLGASAGYLKFTREETWVPF